MREDPYGIWCAIASDLQKGIRILKDECKVHPDVIASELYGIIERILIRGLEDEVNP